MKRNGCETARGRAIGGRGLWLAAAAAGLVSVAAVQPAPAQSNEPPGGPADGENPAASGQGSDAAGAVAMQLKVGRLATADRLTPEPDADPVWQLEADGRRWLFQLPIEIEPGSQSAELDEPTIRLAPGQFLCWRLPAELVERLRERAAEKNAAGQREANRSAPGNAQRDRFGQANPDEAERSQQNGRQTDGDDDSKVRFPESAPRLFVEGRVEPNGLLLWSLAQSIPGLSIHEQAESVYALKIRPRRLRDERPERPQMEQLEEPDFSQAESRAEARQMREQFMRRRREARRELQEAREQYREEVEQYRQKMERVRSLPERFVVPMEGPLLALHAVPRGRVTFEFEFAGDGPGEWRLPLTHLVRVRQLAGHDARELSQMLQRPDRRGNERLGPPGQRSRIDGPARRAAGQAGEFGGQPRGGRRGEGEAAGDAERIKPLVGWARQGHRLTHRLLAHALSERPGLDQLQSDTPRYALYNQLLQSDDAEARQRTVRTLTEAEQANPAVTELLQSHVQRFSPQMQRRTLAALLKQWAGANPGRMVATANTLLHKKAGPPARAVIAAVLAQTEADRRGFGGESITEQARTGITFTGLPAERRAGAIAAVIAQAPAKRLARQWLADPLLSESRDGLIDQTLSQLATAAKTLRQPADTADSAGEPDGGSADSPDNAEKPAVTLDRPIPLGQTSHPLLGLLTAGRDDRRAQAWSALPAFSIAGGEGAGPRRSNNQAGQLASKIAAAGLEAKRVPEVVTMLGRSKGQPTAEAVAPAMLTLAIDAPDEQWQSPAETVLGWGEPVQSAIEALKPARLVTLARRLYQVAPEAGQAEGKATEPQKPTEAAAADKTKPAAGQTVPITAVLPIFEAGRDVRRLQAWFARRVASGTLPGASAWLDQLGGERSALSLVADHPTPAMRRAIAGALVASVRGRLADVDALVKQLSPEAKTAEPPDLDAMEQAWNEVRKAIHARRLEAASGQYQLVLVNQQPEGADTPDRLDLARVELIADGQSLKLAGDSLSLDVAADRLAIELPSPIELKNLAGDWLARQTIQPPPGGKPIQLTPAGDGAWQGELRINARPWLVRLTPATTN